MNVFYNLFLCTCFIMIQIIGMERENKESPLECRYSYFAKHKNLPEQDHELYMDFIAIKEFLTNLSKKPKESSGQIIKGEQTIHGLYLTSSMPPGIISPWFKWLNLWWEDIEGFDENEEVKCWDQIRMFLDLGEPITNKRGAKLYPILGYGPFPEYKRLPHPILNFIHARKLALKNTKTAYIYASTLLKLLEKGLQNNQSLSLKKACLAVIKKNNLSMNGLEFMLENEQSET